MTSRVNFVMECSSRKTDRIDCASAIDADIDDGKNVCRRAFLIVVVVSVSNKGCRSCDWSMERSMSFRTGVISSKMRRTGLRRPLTRTLLQWCVVRGWLERCCVVRGWLCRWSLWWGWQTIVTIGGWDLRRPLINGDFEKLVQSFAGPGGELKCPLWNRLDCCGGG
jgi:hypothetical protein